MQGLGSWLLLEGGTALGTGVVRAPSLLGVTATKMPLVTCPLGDPLVVVPTS